MSKNCKRFEKRIALMADGELSGRRPRSVERHIAQCAACYDFAQRLREDLAVLRALGDEEIDEALRQDLHARVLAQTVHDVAGSPAAPAGLGEQSRKPAWAAAATFALLGLVTALCFFRPSSPRPTLPAETTANQRVLQPKAAVIPPNGRAERRVPTTADSYPEVPETIPAAALPVANEGSKVGESAVVKWYTDNPKVVFFLVADRNEGG